MADLESGRLDDHVEELWRRIQEGGGSTTTATNASNHLAKSVVDDFLDQLNDWTDPSDVPTSVWMVSGGGNAPLRNVPVSINTNKTSKKPRGRPPSAASRGVEAEKKKKMQISRG